MNVHEVATGEAVGRTLQHDSIVNKVLFVSSTTIVTWSDNGFIRLWDAVTGFQLWEKEVGSKTLAFDVGLSGDLIVTVSAPGVATLHRIGIAGIFGESLATILDFCKARFGWAISSLSVETRAHTGTHHSAELTEPQAECGTDQQAQDFLRWLIAEPLTRSAFFGASENVSKSMNELMRGGPCLAVLLVLQRCPGSAEALMLVSEAIAKNDERECRFLAFFTGCDNLQDLQSLGRKWCQLALALSGNSQTFAKRKAALAGAFSPTGHGLSAPIEY